ncbi:MAG TPA: efflux RND transporter periplasmic adaptor subunit, partial [Planctomycetaceae bacterium]
LSQVTTRAGGYVEKLYVDRTFQTVAKGDPLAEVYSPALYQAAQELVLLRGGRSLENLVASAREKLRLLGVGEEEIDEIWKTGKTDARLVLRSPRRGHVIRKNVVEGSRIEEGQTLFELAELSTVWVEADVYEKDLALLREGQEVEATVEAFPGRVFTGRVALIHPHLERATRTNRVRFELANPGHDLRPGMYATVRLTTPIAETEPFRSEIAKRQTPPADADPAALIAWQQDCPVTGLKLGSMGEPLPVSVAGETVFICCKGCEGKLTRNPDEYLAKLAPPPADAVLTVPQTAVIDTGERQAVYVEREPGVFEAVEVTLGPRSGDRYPVLAGLSPGDKVASAGAFLIDAETRLNPAAASAYFGATGGPHSGHANGSVRKSDAGKDDAKRDGAAPAASAGLKPEHLANIAKLPAADQALAKRQKLCPVTELPLGSMGTP